MLYLYLRENDRARRLPSISEGLTLLIYDLIRKEGVANDDDIF